MNSRGFEILSQVAHVSLRSKSSAQSCRKWAAGEATGIDARCVRFVLATYEHTNRTRAGSEYPGSIEILLNLNGWLDFDLDYRLHYESGLLIAAEILRIV